MKVGEVIQTSVRSNSFELRNEIQRCKDRLSQLTPGSQEYADTLKAYDILLSQEKELKKVKTEIKKIIGGAAACAICTVIYRVGFEKAMDPHYRDLAKSFMKFIPLKF